METAARISLLVGLLYQPASTPPPPLDQYFAAVNGDLSRIIFVSGITSRLTLERALAIAASTPSVLTCCVGDGFLLGPYLRDREPVVKPQQARFSELSLEELLDVLIARTSNGDETEPDNLSGTARIALKLDLESPASAANARRVIESRISDVSFPIWLSAEVLPGPVRTRDRPNSANWSTALSQPVFSRHLTLSLSWWTRYIPEHAGVYTADNVRRMWEVAKPLSKRHRVAIVVRASFLSSSSMARLSWLMRRLSRSAFLTVFSGGLDGYPTEPVPWPALVALRRAVGKDRVLLDLHPSLLKKLGDALCRYGGECEVRPPPPALLLEDSQSTASRAPSRPWIIVFISHWVWRVGMK